MAKIVDILAAGPSHSFEFFPPKTPAAERQLEETLRDLEPLHPTFVSVTYGAGAARRDDPRHRHTHQPRDVTHRDGAPDLRGTHRGELTEIVTRYHDAGISNILAFRGDPPKDSEPAARRSRPCDRSHRAGAGRGRLLRRLSAVHPEGHPASTDRATDRRRQAEKLARADFGISQFFFEASVWFEFLGDLRELRVTSVARDPGIMPVLNVKSVKRMAEMSGADFPGALEAGCVRSSTTKTPCEPSASRRRPSCAASSWREASIRSTSYTLNRSSTTREIYSNLGFGRCGRQPARRDAQRFVVTAQIDERLGPRCQLARALRRAVMAVALQASSLPRLTP